MVPADDQAIVLPCASVMVIMVLLNDAFTCATPEAMFLRSRRRTRVASLPIHDPFRDSVRLIRPLQTWLRPRRPTSSCRQSPWPAPCGSGHWYGCAGRAPGGRGGAAGLDSSPD